MLIIRIRIVIVIRIRVRVTKMIIMTSRIYIRTSLINSYWRDKNR